MSAQESAKEREERAYAAWWAAEEEQERLRQEINVIIDAMNKDGGDASLSAAYHDRMGPFKEARERTRQTFDAWSKAWDEWRAEDS